MEGQPRIEELLNKIIFLRKALEYYAENSTYANTRGVAPIDADRGYQARFALEQTETIEEFNQSLIEEYKKAVDEEKARFEEQGIDEESVERMEDVIKLMNKYKEENGL